MSHNNIVTSSNDSPRLRATRQKVRNFLQLPVGWNYGEGVAPSPENVRLVLELLDFASAQGFRKTNAFPGNDGEIALTIYLADSYLDLTVWEDASVDIREEEGNEEVHYAEGQTVEEAKSKILDFKEKLWPSSESLTSHIGITTSSSSTISPFRVISASLSLTPTALLRAAAASVSILVASTGSPQATQHVSGPSPTVLSPRDASPSEGQPQRETTATTNSLA